MEKSVIPFYRNCFVPQCNNTIRNSPNKLFFHIPQNMKVRKHWWDAMRRDDEISLNNSLYCCEDHFNIEEDTENYIRYKIMALQRGQKVKLRLKKGVVPHIFRCQDYKPSPETNNICLSSSYDHCEEGPSTLKIEIEDYEYKIDREVSPDLPEINNITKSSSYDHYEKSPSTPSLKIAILDNKYKIDSMFCPSLPEMTDDKSSSHDHCEESPSPPTLKIEIEDYEYEIDSEGRPSIASTNVQQITIPSNKDLLLVDKGVQVDSEVCNINVLKVDKGTQVNIKVRYKSKGVNAKICKCQTK